MFFYMINKNYVKPLTKQKYIEVEVCDQESLEYYEREIVDAEIYKKLQRDLSTDSNVNYKYYQVFWKWPKQRISQENKKK